MDKWKSGKLYGKNGGIGEPKTQTKGNAQLGDAVTFLGEVSKGYLMVKGT